MINNLEIEYKILVTQEQFEKLSSLYPNKTFVKQVNTYYDTDDFYLRNRKCSLRIREKNHSFMITLKVPETNGHHEFECFVHENSPEAILNSQIKDILNQFNISSVHKIGSCTTHRAMIKTDKAELCFDINEYNHIIDYEIEYEQTCDHDGIKEFNKILSQIDLKYEKNCSSKIKRTLESL